MSKITKELIKKEEEFTSLNQILFIAALLLSLPAITFVILLFLDRI